MKSKKRKKKKQKKRKKEKEKKKKKRKKPDRYQGKVHKVVRVLVGAKPCVSVEHGSSKYLNAESKVFLRSSSFTFLSRDRATALAAAPFSMMKQG